MKAHKLLPPIPPEPAFRRLIVSRLLTALAAFMVPALVTMHVLGENGSAGALGLVLGLGALPGVLTLFLSGLLTDRVDKKRLVIFGDVLNAGAMAGASGALAFGIAPLWALAGVSMTTSVTSALLYPAYGGLLASTLAPENLQQGNALRSIIGAGSTILGPVMASALAMASPSWLPWTVCALFYLMGAGIVVGIGVTTDTSASGTPPWAQAKQGWRYFWGQRWLRNMTAFSAVWHLLVWAPLLVLGPTVLATHHGDADAWGLYLGFQGVGLLVAGMVAGRLQVGRILLPALGGLVVVMGSTLIFALHAPLPVLVVTGLVTGAGLCLAEVFWGSAMQGWIPKDKIGQMLSYDYLVSVGLLPLGFALAPLLGSWLGLQGALLLGGAATLLAAVATALDPAVRSKSTAHTGSESVMG